MPLSYKTITGNSGSPQSTFTLDFPYILKDHIKVYYGRDILANTQTSTLVDGTDYNFTSDNTIQLIGSTLNSGTTTGNPHNLANGVVLTLERDTPDSSQIVEFQDGSNLIGDNLNNANLQNLFVVQEQQDKNDISAAKSIAAETASNAATANVANLTSTQFASNGSIPMSGDINANSNKIKNLADPTNDQDGVTKAYLERTGSITSTQIFNGTIVNDDINANADIAVSKLDHGTARQILQTNAAGNNVEFTSNVDIPGTLDVTGNVDLDANLNVDGTTTLDATTVDGTLTATSVTVGGLNISHTIDNGSPHRSVLLHNGTDDLRLQIAGNQMIFEKAGGENFISLTHSTGKINISHADGTTGVVLSTTTNGIEVTGQVDLDSITGAGVVTSGTSTSDTQVYSAKRAGEIFYEKTTLDDITSGDTWVSDDNKIATTAAIDARVVDLVDDVGGFVPIANETSFPNANPDVNNGAGTLISIAALSQNLTSNAAGEIAINNGTVGNSAVFLVGAPANTTFTAGFGLIVETKDNTGGVANTYTFHRYVPNATTVTTVAGSIGNVNTVAGEISPTNNISAVASVVNILSAFDATFRGQVTTVANDATDIGAVAGKATEIGLLGTAAAVADMDLLGKTAVIADMATIADTSGLIGNIGTVAGIHGDVTAVAGNNSNITDVKNNETNINAVKNNESNINSAVSNASNINTVAGQLGASGSVTTVATNLSNITNASNYLNNFLQLYLGEASSDPVSDGLGNAITEGDTYFNNVDKRMRVFNGSVFQNVGEGLIEVAKFATSSFSSLYTASAGSNSIDLGGLAVSGAAFANEAITAIRASLAKGSGTFNLGGI